MYLGREEERGDKDGGGRSMNAKIWKIENDENGVQIFLFIGRPRIPVKGDYFKDIESLKDYETDKRVSNQDLQRFNKLHLGEAELIQGADK